MYAICWKSSVIVRLHSYYHVWETIQEDICTFTSQELMHPLSWISGCRSCVPVLQTLLMLTTHNFIIHRCMCVHVDYYCLFIVHTLRAYNSPFLLSRTLFFLTQLCLYASTRMLILLLKKVCLLFKWQVYACLHHIYICTLWANF